MTARAAERVTAAGGFWHSTGSWVGGIAPTFGAGERIRILHGITVKSNANGGSDIDFGESLATSVPLSGTHAITTNGDVTVHGTGTLYLTEVRIGERFILPGGANACVDTITDNFTLTLMQNNTSAVSGVAATIRPAAIYVKGGTGKLTLETGRMMTCRGDGNWRQSNPTWADCVVDLNSSLAPGGVQPYQMELCTGGQNSYTSLLIATGTTGSYGTLKSTGGYGSIVDGGGSSSGVSIENYNLINIGNLANDGIHVAPNGSTTKMRIKNCKVNACGRFYNLTLALAADFEITGNEWVSYPAGATSLTAMEFNTVAGLPTGLRLFTDNVAQDPLIHVGVNWTISARGLTYERNCIGRVTSPQSGTMASVKYNASIHRNQGDPDLTNWDFFGSAGDIIDFQITVNDSGGRVTTQQEGMMNDSPNAAGVWTLRNSWYERISASGGGNDFVHVASASVSPFTMRIEKCIVAPRHDGVMSGQIRGRGNANTFIQAIHNTVVTNGSDAMSFGSEFNGFASMVPDIDGNLGWSPSKTSTGKMTSYSAAVANVLVPTGLRSNAHFNGGTGNLRDAAGANPTPALGHDGWRNGTKPTLADEVNLGTGSADGMENVEGPMFKNSRRNFALFDSDFLGNVATPWAHNTNYAVGDFVSVSDPAWYYGATLNLRCCKTHLSDAASTVNGKPMTNFTDTAVGYPSGYRDKWELASAYRLRRGTADRTLYTDATLGLTNASINETCITWMRDGFRPQNAVLHATAWDGSDIGAMPYLAPSGGLPAPRRLTLMEMGRDGVLFQMPNIGHQGTITSKKKAA